jgi:Spy/CpxP family protein refolding chaperone
MKRRNLVGMGLIALSLLGAMTAYGRPNARESGDRFGVGVRGTGFPLYVLKGVNLTTEQQTQVQAIREAHQQTGMKLQTELRSANDAVVKKFLTAGDLTTESFTGDTQRITELEAQLLKERIAIGVKVRKVLTADQLAKAAEIIAKQQERRAQQESLLKKD